VSESRRSGQSTASQTCARKKSQKLQFRRSEAVEEKKPYQGAVNVESRLFPSVSFTDVPRIPIFASRRQPPICRHRRSDPVVFSSPAPVHQNVPAVIRSLLIVFAVLCLAGRITTVCIDPRLSIRSSDFVVSCCMSVMCYFLLLNGFDCISTPSAGACRQSPTGTFCKCKVPGLWIDCSTIHARYGIRR